MRRQPAYSRAGRDGSCYTRRTRGHTTTNGRFSLMRSIELNRRPLRSALLRLLLPLALLVLALACLPVATAAGERTLHLFGSGADGAKPAAALVADASGALYGTTVFGGSGSCPGGCGTVFSLSVGLDPFVKAEPGSGEAGAAVMILGTNLTGASRVTFNGAAAEFTVVSSSEIRATVPGGASSGKVEVATPHGVLSSNVPFQVVLQPVRHSPPFHPRPVS